MSRNDDLALVTACRDVLDRWFGDKTPDVIAVAALSLIEHTLNRHRAYLSTPSRGCALCGATARFEATALGTLLLNESDHWPCESYDGALTALHTIATALGVEVPV